MRKKPSLKIKKIAYLLIFIVFLLSGQGLPARAKNSNKVEIKDGWFYVEGEKFFVKGVCFFENHTVEGEFRRSSLDVIDYEFKRIKEAGFNTIRSQLRPQELKLAQKHGLMVMQGANHLCFCDEYKDPKVIKEQIDTTRNIMHYSKDYDNILYYIIDNEPQIEEGIYREGEEAIISFYKILIKTVKEIQPEAAVSVATYPPAAFLDYSIFDCVCLNLYPFFPARNVMAYDDYGRWFKKRYARNKPFIFSEYGWGYARPEGDFSKTMINLLDEQIASGACGSFFYTWRSFGQEARKDNLWRGIIPNEGKKDDYMNKPRPIYYDFQKYFEAVIIKPKKEGLYSKRIPVEVYGSDKTRSVRVYFDDKVYNLKRQGKYWWKTNIPINPAKTEKKTIIVEAKDKNKKTLTKKKQDIFLSREKETLSVKIIGDNKNLKEGDTYKAKVIICDDEGKRIAHQNLCLGINQTKDNLWTSKVLRCKADESGEYEFRWNNVLFGYFTLVAAAQTDKEYIRLYPDIDIIRVKKR